MNRKQMDAALGQAFAAFERGNAAKAEALYEQCRKSLAFFHTRAQRMNLLMGLSYVKSALQKHGEARACAGQLYAHSRARKGRYIALHQMALVEKAAGDARRALELLNEELSNLKAYHKRDDQKHAICHYERAQAMLSLGLREDALYALLDALQAAEKSRDDMTVAMAARALGLLHQGRGDRDKARDALKKARDAFAEAEDMAAMQEVEDMLRGL